MNTLEELYSQIDRLEEKRLLQDLSGAEHGELLRLNRDAEKLRDEAKETMETEKQEKSREMRNRRRRGKYGEKRVAKQVGGRVDGRAGKKDVRKGMFYFEVKSLKKTPKFNDNVLMEAKRHCPSGQIAIGVIRNTTERTAITLMDWNDFIDIHGK